MLIPVGSHRLHDRWMNGCGRAMVKINGIASHNDVLNQSGAMGNWTVNTDPSPSVLCTLILPL